MLRTNNCGELSKKNVGKKVKLSGWIDTLRQHGKIGFVDLRDRYGKTQLVFLKDTSDSLKNLSVESCVLVEGEVKERKKGTENKELSTGDIEVVVSKIEIYNKSGVLPFEIGDSKVSEDLRLKYRYLDLRSEGLQKKMILKHELYQAIRNFMDKQGFLNLETPILGKSTPEGARDYIVPSRVKKGKFYALPQSPQLFKQLFMVAGFDRYYQIVKCFRDEDLRADRQPEFTQLDIEMSFIEEEDIISEMEKLMKYVFKEVLDVDLKIPFPRIGYEDSMKKYGKDNPDIRTEKQKKSGDFGFTWVVDFPSFEFDSEEKRYVSVHHPFTMPKGDFSKPEKMKSKAYDLVLNGSEIGGGSIRIHDLETQSKVFEVLGIDKKEAKDKFGFLLEALSFGAPPHGGIAFGLDRLAAIMSESESIRDVIPFPKNKSAEDLMLKAPSEVAKKQLDEVGLKIGGKK
jgi:aspartyl-tRNA synthetase